MAVGKAIVLSSMESPQYLYSVDSFCVFCLAHTYLVPLTQTMKAEVRKGDRYE